MTTNLPKMRISTRSARICRRAKACIQVRIDRLVLGLPGDVKQVGEGISELRIDYGPGYRVYFVRRAEMLIVLLAGGGKGSQNRDISTALVLARSLQEQTMPKTKTIPWDSADHLETTEDIAAYLEAAFEDGDPALINHALGVVARAKGMTEIAQRTGMGRQSLYKGAVGRRPSRIQHRPERDARARPEADCYSRLTYSPGRSTLGGDWHETRGRHR